MVLKPKLWSLLHSPYSSLLGPSIRLRILFSITLTLRSSLNVTDHTSQPCCTNGKIIVLYILIVKQFPMENQLNATFYRASLRYLALKMEFYYLSG